MGWMYSTKSLEDYSISQVLHLLEEQRYNPSVDELFVVRQVRSSDPRLAIKLESPKKPSSGYKAEMQKLLIGINSTK